MKKVLKFLGALALVIGAASAGVILYFNAAFPKVGPAENITIDSNPVRLARGKYLVENVTGCIGCHSDRDLTRYNYPVKEGTWGQGGFKFDHQLMGLPGTLYSRNITPRGLKNWTDGEIVRVLRTGVNRRNGALFPLMPYQHLRGLCQEDLFSIVAYLRTLKPVAYDPPPTKLEFPVNFIVKTIPRDAGPFPPAPDPKDKAAYARYMVNATSCYDCHTPMDSHGAPLPGMDFSGGMEFHFPDGSTLRPANITPDKKTGIGDWTKDYFIKRFRLGKQMAEKALPVKPGEFNTLMPWDEYGGMTDGDLGAIYDFLHEQVKPVEHAVDKFTPPGTETAISN
jgi:mono/diheme cytochrome c family protein